MLNNSNLAPLNTIVKLREEASSRQYFRLRNKESSLIGVFSPPEKELNRQFVFLSLFLKKEGVTVPEVFYFDESLGFMLIEDFGDEAFQFSINRSNFHHLFSSAIDEMVNINKCPHNENLSSLSRKDLKDQMVLFEKWFLRGLLQIKPKSEEIKMINSMYDEILDNLEKQPKALCHFDFETRNLMVLESGSTGVLDFQDAIFGPIFLDPASLLKDLHLELKDSEVNQFLDSFLSKSIESGLIKNLEFQEARECFDFASLQRQLRILGTLSRLHIRDKKSFRLPDLVKTLEFFIETTSKYKKFKTISKHSRNKILPILNLKIKEIL
tara:strand:+ start:1212 stop:2186 length:975 start_codon:yes stop_codon:yes gene_type:complete